MRHPQVGSASPATPAAAYAYSCSRGAFLGVSFDSTLLKVRHAASLPFTIPVTLPCHSYHTHASGPFTPITPHPHTTPHPTQVRDGANAAFYGLPVTPAQLLVERRVAPPPAAAALYDALRALDLKWVLCRLFTLRFCC